MFTTPSVGDYPTVGNYSVEAWKEAQQYKKNISQYIQHNEIFCNGTDSIRIRTRQEIYGQMKPQGVPECKGLYLTLYHGLSPFTDSV